MIRSLLLAACMLIAASTQAQEKLQLKATIQGLPAGTPIYLRQLGGDKVDSVLSAAGSFGFQLPAFEAGPYFLSIGKSREANSSMLLYLQGSTLTMKGAGPLLKDIVISGNAAFVKDQNDYLAKMKVASEGATALYEKYNEAYKAKDTVTQQELKSQLDELRAKQQAIGKDWVAARPGSIISTFILFTALRHGLSPEQLEQELGKLQKDATRNKMFERMQQIVRIAKLTAIGQLAPDFTQADTAGRNVSLQSFRGKYLLIDFWASWCGPCRKENPGVVKAFQEFKDKNFTILGISLDQPGKKAAWLKAIHDDNLTWTHVSDLQYWNNAVARQYDIHAIPANLLLDPQGKIVAKDLHGEELAAKLKELLQ